MSVRVRGMMKIPLLDLKAQYLAIRSEIDGAIQQVLESGHFVLGPNVQELEQEVAAYLGVKHAIGVASGTDALIISLESLGIGAGDEVIVPSYTFFATAEAVLQVGARPVFVDIEPDTYCLDVQQVTEHLTAHTKAVIPVHMYGHPAPMGPLLELAGSHGFKVIEDNAQAMGAEYDGKKTGSLGDTGCLSFFPSKNLGAYGDGGMVVTNDTEINERARMLRTHGWRKKNFPEIVGYNSRLDELQAAILRIKLNHLDAWSQRRREVAAQYKKQLSDLGIGVPYEASSVKHVYHLFVVRLRQRDEVLHYLREKGIGSAVYYPHPLHLTQPCQFLGLKEGDLAVTEQMSRETLAIPLYPEMSDQEVQEVVAALEGAMVGSETQP